MATTPPAWTSLKEYVNATDDQDTYVEWAFDEAVTLVTSFIGTAPVPSAIVGRAILETGSALYNRRQDSNGIRGYNGDGTPIFVAKDPMNAVYPMLRRWVLPF